MADEADIADIIQARNLERSLHEARTAKPGITANGQCHFCDADVSGKLLFCDHDCQKDWEREQAALQRTGKARQLEVAEA